MAYTLAPAYYYTKQVPDTPTTFTIDLGSITDMGYVPEDSGVSATISPEAGWVINATPPDGLSMVTSGLVFQWGVAGAKRYFSRDGALFTDFNMATGGATAVGNVSDTGQINITTPFALGGDNSIFWVNAAHDRSGSQDIFEGVFRVATAPIKAGSFQIQDGSAIGSANSGGVISGDFTGEVDFVRGIVRWAVSGLGPGADDGVPVRADQLTYNAVYLQYVPLDEDLLGLNTVRLPLDGRVPIFRAGGQVLVHNTLETTLTNPISKNVQYDLGRQRIAAVTVRDATGERVPGTLYEVNFTLGKILIPTAADISAYTQPFKVEDRIEDELLVLRADISGKLELVAGLTHDYPAETSFVSSKLRKGDLFARAYNVFDQQSWTNEWSDSVIGSTVTATYNAVDYPIVVTNRGAIKERWALIFTGSTSTVRVVGEGVGQIVASVSITGDIAPINPATGAPYFTIPAGGWGTGWSVGNVVRFNTDAAGSPVHILRAVLQGPPSVASDKFTLAFRADVDA